MRILETTDGKHRGTPLDKAIFVRGDVLYLKGFNFRVDNVTKRSDGKIELSNPNYVIVIGE